MKRIVFILVAAWSLGQDAALPSGLLVLKDGRLLAIRGTYEVFGDEVQFTDGNGELMSLPASKVDWEQTERRNREISEAPPGRDDDTLPPHVKRYVPSPTRETSTTAGQERESGSSGTPARSLIMRGEPGSPPDAEPQTRERFPQLREWETYQGKIQEAWGKQTTAMAVTLIGLGLLLILSMLVSWLTQLYLIFRSFSIHFFWGILLLGTYLIPLFFSFLFFLQGGGWLNMFLSSGIRLCYIFLLFLFILLNCQGSRLKFYFLWLSPLLFLTGFIAAGWIAFLSSLS